VWRNRAQAASGDEAGAMIPAVIGIVLALLAAAFARFARLDRDRSFYPTVLAVIAVLYTLFAMLGGGGRELLEELPATSAFLVLVVLGMRRSPWIIVSGLAAHGVFDFLHPLIYTNPGVPPWWPAFCAAYDLAAAGCMAVLLRAGGGGAQATGTHAR
jgi:hypothetical protein